MMKIILFPGYFDENWLNFRATMFKTTSLMQYDSYSSLTILSSLLTICAIAMIIKTSKHLMINNSHVNLNMKAMVIHSSLLAV